jgi:hypothetical protein
MKTKNRQKPKNQPRNGKKATVESKAVKTKKSEAGPRRTIKQVVIETFTANSAVTNDEMIAAVKAEFPKSAFKETHAARYRSQARKGLLTGTPVAIPAQIRKKAVQNRQLTDDGKIRHAGSDQLPHSKTANIPRSRRLASQQLEDLWQFQTGL